MCKNAFFTSPLLSKKADPIFRSRLSAIDFSLQNLYFILSLLSNQENCIAQY